MLAVETADEVCARLRDKPHVLSKIEADNQSLELFPAGCDYIFMVPIRPNNNIREQLLTFLERLNAINLSRIGVIFLINSNDKDNNCTQIVEKIAETAELLKRSQSTSGHHIRYYSRLGNANGPHFGLLRHDLLLMARRLSTCSDPVVHFFDIDTDPSCCLSHIDQYSKGAKAVIAEGNLHPALLSPQSRATQQEIEHYNHDSIRNIEVVNFLHFIERLFELLEGIYQEISPAISAKYSLLSKLGVTGDKSLLLSCKVGEDFALTQLLGRLPGTVLAGFFDSYSEARLDTSIGGAAHLGKAGYRHRLNVRAETTQVDLEVNLLQIVVERIIDALEDDASYFADRFLGEIKTADPSSWSVEQFVSALQVVFPVLSAFFQNFSTESAAIKQEISYLIDELKKVHRFPIRFSFRRELLGFYPKDNPTLILKYLFSKLSTVANYYPKEIHLEHNSGGGDEEMVISVAVLRDISKLVESVASQFGVSSAEFSQQLWNPATGGQLEEYSLQKDVIGISQANLLIRALIRIVKMRKMTLIKNNDQ